ncbi:MAG: hypothetical protein LC775_20325, partial [Acidobacteria bacterium]|nr:hypothetical protein [Acidobacteriota bacterium]
EWEARTLPIGKNIPLGKISADLSTLPAPGGYKLIVTVAPASFFTSVDRKIIPGPGVTRGVTYFENDWNFWLYPSSNLSATAVNGPIVPKEQSSRLTPTHHSPAAHAVAGGGRESVRPEDCPPARSGDVLVTRSWDEAEKKLAAGGRVLFVPRYSDLDWSSPPLDSVPIFWNRLMTPAWGRMLGLWIPRDPSETKSHALDGFPTSSHFDWQWAEIIHNVRGVNLDRLPAELEPVVWAIDDWNRNYKLGVIFEAAVGDGRLLVSAFDVANAASRNPVALQLRRSLLQYAGSDCFQPQISLFPEQIRSLLFDTRVMEKLGAVAQADGMSANNVIDGDPNTFIQVGT